MSARAVFTTERTERHQRDSLSKVPDGLDVTMLREPDRETLAVALAEADYLISERRGTVDASLMDAAPDLKLILRLGGMSHDIDLAAAREHGMIVCRCSQEGAIRVAEFVVLQTLALLRRVMECREVALEAGDDWAERRTTDENSFAYNWSRREGLIGLHGLTVGVLGFGEIGAELARKLRGWDCFVLYHRRTPLPQEVELELGLVRVDRSMLLQASDVLVCLLPYTEQTRGSLDAELISSMKPGAVLVSAGSGGVIDEPALAAAIESGRLAGAAFDTFAVEPVEAGNPLVALARSGKNLLLTPHVAGGSPSDAWDELARMYQPVVDHMAGRPVSGRLV